MINLFKTKYDKLETISAPVEGRIQSLDIVKDEMFRNRVLGDGFAVEPASNIFVAPCDGSITMLFPTLHAYGIKTNSGIDILVHIGIDTINEDGLGFHSLKRLNDKVKRGEKIIEVNIEALRQKDYDVITLCIITNLSACSDYKVDLLNKENIMSYVIKK